MPAKYERCVKHVQATGKSKSSAHAICTSKNVGNIKQVRKREASERPTNKYRGMHG